MSDKESSCLLLLSRTIFGRNLSWNILFRFLLLGLGSLCYRLLLCLGLFLMLCLLWLLFGCFYFLFFRLFMLTVFFRVFFSVLFLFFSMGQTFLRVRIWVSSCCFGIFGIDQSTFVSSNIFVFLVFMISGRMRFYSPCFIIVMNLIFIMSSFSIMWSFSRPYFFLFAFWLFILLFILLFRTGLLSFLLSLSLSLFFLFFLFHYIITQIPVSVLVFVPAFVTLIGCLPPTTTGVFFSTWGVFLSDPRAVPVTGLLLPAVVGLGCGSEL